MSIYFSDKIKLEDFDNLKRAKYIKNIIINNIQKSNYELAKIKLDEYEKTAPWDIEIPTIKAIIYMNEGDLAAAKSILEEAKKILPYNFDINYNIGYIYELEKKYMKAFEHYIRAMQVVQDKDEINTIKEALTNLEKQDPNLDFSELKRVNNKLFPLRTQNDTWIGKTMLTDNKEQGYIPLYYNENIYEYPLNFWNFYKNEILYSRLCKNYLILNNLNKGEKVLPIAILKENTNISVIKNNDKININNLIPKRYYYIPIEENIENIEIKSNDTIIVGDLIESVQREKNDVKLNLNIFIDGLAQKVIDEFTLLELMPNTFKFFSKGTIFNNCFSNAEWTLPSVASINMSKHLHNHHIFHPEIIYDVNERGKIMPLYFKQKGYLTFQSCGNWRKTPSYGYISGYDRTIYQSATVGSEAEDIIFNFLEHMRAFENRDHFVWLTFFELHKIQDAVTPKISSQVKSGSLLKLFREKNIKSVDLNYDPLKSENYINEIKRLDFYLKIIYDFIEEKYADDEIVVSLFSDHGVSFLDNDDFMLRNARTKIPFMIRGKNIPVRFSDELIEGVDILPTVLYKSGIDYDKDSLDGRVPRTLNGTGKDFIISESIYPGKTYKAAIRDENYYFTFESEGLVENDGRVNLGNYKTMLFKIDELIDISNNNKEKTIFFTEIILDKIKYFIKM